MRNALQWRPFWNSPIWPLEKKIACLSADSEITRSCQLVTKNSDFCNEVNDYLINPPYYRDDPRKTCSNVLDVMFLISIPPVSQTKSPKRYLGGNWKLFKHWSFDRNYIGVKQQTTSVTIYGDTGRYPLFLKQQILSLKYWVCLPKSCYLRIVYNSLASLDFIGETNWCSHIRSLLFRTNHCDVWKNHRVENANRLIKQVKLFLINIYKADWSNKARNSIKLRTYIKIKFDHSLEEYLFYIPDTRWMKALSRLRMSWHNARNWKRKACQAAKNATRTTHMSKMYIKLCWWRNSFFNYLLLLRYAAN